MYDLLSPSGISEVLWLAGLSVHHSAIEVYGQEYSFGGAIFHHLNYLLSISTIFYCFSIDFLLSFTILRPQATSLTSRACSRGPRARRRVPTGGSPSTWAPRCSPRRRRVSYAFLLFFYCFPTAFHQTCRSHPNSGAFYNNEMMVL